MEEATGERAETENKIKETEEKIAELEGQVKEKAQKVLLRVHTLMICNTAKESICILTAILAGNILPEKKMYGKMVYRYGV